MADESPSSADIRFELGRALFAARLRLRRAGHGRQGQRSGDSAKDHGGQVFHRNRGSSLNPLNKP